MKRFLSAVLCVTMLASLSICAQAKDFSDLSADHWAYANIQTLVNEGTINGYEDGTFMPSKTVTRAEFVKMLGKWDRVYNGTFSDISSNHWAYEYIMWSGLEPVGSAIYPDTPMLRSDVINLIWKRNGSPKHSAAPGAIISQGTNDDATSWAYTIGLMKGDDGLNLRLSSSLTRAEAATLIVRSRELVSQNAKNNFVDVVSGDLLAKTYESVNLLGDTYNPNRTFTYGEVARMAVTFGADGKNINFVGNDLLNSKGEIGKFFEHKYSNELFILASNVWGDEYYTKEKADKTATVQDTVSALIYAYVRRGTAPMDLGGKGSYYPDCTDAESSAMEKLCLEYANKKGIKLYAGDNLGAAEEITAKKCAAILLQLNEKIGLGVCYVNGSKGSVKMNTSLSDFPANYKDFKLTVSGVPVALYNIKKDGVDAKSAYNSLNQLASVYTAYLSELANAAKKETGRTLEYTFYPSVSFKQNGNVNFVAKFVMKDNNDGMGDVSVDKLFGKVVKEPTGKVAQTNKAFYVVFETYGPLMDLYLPLSGAYLKAAFVS